MKKHYLVSVFPTHAADAPLRRQVSQQLRDERIAAVQCLSTGQLYRVEGECSAADVERAARELFSDSVTEQFAIDDAPSVKNTVFADVWYKPGVTDPAADSAVKALRDMGIAGVEKIATGTRVQFQFSASPSEALIKEVQRFAARFLLNPLVQECKISV